MMVPIIFLALITACLLLLMVFVTKIQENTLRMHAENYFEAMAKVLNADRDLYQARLAQEQILSKQSDLTTVKKEFEENAQQVFDRFHQYREFLRSAPLILKRFSNFDDTFKAWFDASKRFLDSAHGSVELSERFLILDETFMEIRGMLDKAGEDLRTHAREVEKRKGGIKDIERYVEAITEVLNADRDIYQARLALQKIANGVGDFDVNNALFHENAQQVIRRFNAYRYHLSSERFLIDEYSKFDDLFNQWYQGNKELLSSGESQSRKMLSKEFIAADESFAVLRQILDEAGEAIREHAKTEEDRASAKIEKMKKGAMTVISIAFVVALFFGYLIPRRITQDVDDMCIRIREIAEGDGDLTQRIDSKSKDEIGDLAREFDAFVERLRSIISNISEQSLALGSTTESLNEVSEQAGGITEALVTASESIVSAGNQMSMSNQQMAETAKNTATEADSSNQLTKQGMDAVRSSSQSIENLVADIELTLTRATELEKSSEAIASVLEVIRNIAEQTNLLALNAAIEAARAGEQGRGFAVVADEVRTLATRTQQSTDEIESMIEQLKSNVAGSSHSIQNCRANATDTVSSFEGVSRVFNDLNISFQKVQEMAAHTSQATQEQSEVADSITQNLVSLKEQTDGVEEMSGQIKSQSRELSQLYRRLSQQVGSFKT
ncbi:methyl-accepting chemotaxis protein [Alteromonas sp. a30]|uniref:methyl-accepting chemotaxis protein n=1 Tax=Alteromonas sp. a30 TaxID=2730917 RepID=UPI00227E11DE|nr:methyl-accepting chemotaxis protein [Alteromonas sp. a30]